MTSKEKIIDAIVKNKGITSKQISEQTGISSKTVSNNLAQIIKQSDIERELKDGIFIYSSTEKPAEEKPAEEKPTKEKPATQKPVEKQRKLSRSQRIYIMREEGKTAKEVITEHPDWSASHIRNAFYFAKNNPDKVKLAIEIRDNNEDKD